MLPLLWLLPVVDVTGVTIFDASSTDLIVGARETSGGGSYEQYLNADVDEVIITEGVARYPVAGFRPRYRAARWG